MTNQTAITLDELLDRNSEIHALKSVREMKPVAGFELPVYPPTYSGVPGYAIAKIDDNGGNVVVLDSVASSANRIERQFKEDERIKDLHPQVTVVFKGEGGDYEYNVLDVGHRIADASVRASSLSGRIQKAFEAAMGGNHAEIARLCPAALLFGVWDSRVTHHKKQRAMRSEIMARDVSPLDGPKQYFATVHKDTGLDYGSLGVVNDDPDATADGEAKPAANSGEAKGGKEKKASAFGLANASPKTEAAKHRGGVLVKGGITWGMTLSMAMVRSYRGADANETEALQRYLLGLGVVAMTLPPREGLRSGCDLVLNGREQMGVKTISVYGEEVPLNVTLDEAIQFTKDAAAELDIVREEQAELTHDHLKEWVRDKKEETKKPGAKE
ncbi:MAG: type I-U CRISPR-associated protein Cas7 [Nevskiales bacterium]|nr:type I-U CRISPR-associated protein Cas7 [Nevskiales bacterium]